MYCLTLINWKIGHKYMSKEYLNRSIAQHNGVKVLLEANTSDWLELIDVMLNRPIAHLYRLETDRYKIVITITTTYKNFVWGSTYNVDNKIVSRLIHKDAPERLPVNQLHELIAYGKIISV